MLRVNACYRAPMERALRPLAVLLAVLAFVAGGAATAHDHADDPDAAPCSVCVVAADAEHAVPPPAPTMAALPITQPEARAFALRTAVRPPVTIVPPGRAPPTPL